MDKLVLAEHISSILNISEEDAKKWIDEDKVIRKYIKSNNEESKKEADNNHKVKNMKKKRGIFVLNGEETRLEKVFLLWFQKTGEDKKMSTIERYLNGKTKARKDLKGYLKSTSIDNIDTFVMLFNLLIMNDKDGNLALNGGSK